MIDHIGVGVSDYGIAKAFYTRALRPIGYELLLEFSAEWCAPCKQIAPEVEAFAREMEGKVKVLKVDIDRSPVVAQQLRIQSVPTFMVVAEGRIKDGVFVANTILAKHDEKYMPPEVARSLKQNSASSPAAAAAGEGH